jgi:hypothetical protein
VLRDLPKYDEEKLEGARMNWIIGFREGVMRCGGCEDFFRIEHG